MPRISVHLEAESAAEFRSLLAAFQTEWDRWGPEPKGDGEPDVVNEVYAPEPEPEVEQPVAAETAKEPAQPRRGRPRKEKPVAETAAVADVAEPEAEPQPEPAPVTAKPAKANGPAAAATRQDLLDAFSEYVQRYGASFGFSDISSLLQKNLGEGVRKASDVPEDKLQVAIGAIKTAIADNPFNRKRDYA